MLITLHYDSNATDTFDDPTIEIHFIDASHGVDGKVFLTKHGFTNLLQGAPLETAALALSLEQMLQGVTATAMPPVSDVEDAVIVAEGEQIARDAEAHANRPVRRYSDDVKDDAIARYFAGEKVQSICTSIGILQPTFYRWLRHAGVPLRQRHAVVKAGR